MKVIWAVMAISYSLARPVWSKVTGVTVKPVTAPTISAFAWVSLPTRAKRCRVTSSVAIAWVSDCSTCCRWVWLVSGCR